MSDTTKLRAIQEALDAQRPLELDALDAATRESAEPLARVDAWLRARPASLAFASSELDDPETFTARIEARLGETLDDDFDPLAVPDFADFGDVDEIAAFDEPEASNVVSIAKARAVTSPASPTSPAADASISVSGGFAPAPAASAPVAAKVERSTGASGTGSSSTGRGSVGRWFASAAVVLLAATGSLVVFRSASSPDAAEVAAAPAASSSTVAVTESAFAPTPGAAPAEPTARFAIEAEFAEEAPADRRRAENAQGLGGALRAEGAVGGAATGASFEGMLDTTALEGPREQLARARPATRATSTPMPSMAERGAADNWAPEAPAAAAPTMSAPTTAASARTVTAAAPSREVADPSVNEEVAVAEDETGLVHIDRWRTRVLSCVPTLRTLTTRVEARDGRVSAVLETIPTLDAAARGCVERALRGAPLDRPRATLRWKRER